MPTNHLGRLTVIFVVLLAGIWAIFPSMFVNPGVLLHPLANHNLKPGIDMVGGTSLLYEIKPPDGRSMENLSEQVMDALKKRVDPDGVKNLVWRPQGNTRLEIQMPLTGGGNAEDARKVRAAYGEARKALEETKVRLASVTDAVERLKGEEREKRLATLGQDSEVRKGALAGLARAWDAVEAAKGRNDSAAIAAGLLEMERLRAEIASTDVDVRGIEQLLDTIEEAKEKQARVGTRVAPGLAGAEEALAGYKAKAAKYPRQLELIEKLEKAHEAFFRVRNQLDDAGDLKRLLQGSGVLEFFIAVDPADARVPDMVQRLQSGQTRTLAEDTCAWYAANKNDDLPAPGQWTNRSGAQAGVTVDYGGRRWVLLDTRPETSITAKSGAKWSLTRAGAQTDSQSGSKVVSFELDTQGGIYMGRLTAANTQRPMAIVLDGRVYSAPNINSQINGSGIIQGNYSAADLTYLINTLNAGSLPAQLADQPISERTVGPQLGADNLRTGFLACGFGLVAVAVFLVGYYYLAGCVAYVAVVINLVLILASLAALNATFTLPSVAALVLTLGSAVDANVLIFERLREEQQRGFPIRTALRNSYDRAFSAIVDSNVVTGITSLVLYLLGSEEVKGFGLTLLLGIITSLFTSLYVTKTLFAILVDKFGVRRLGSVPMSVPWWDRLLKPNIDWMGKVWILGLSSVGVMVVGLVLFGKYIAAGQMFDIEFSSGTAVTIDLKAPMKQEDVRRLLETSGGKEVLVPLAGGAEKRTTVGQALPAALPVSVGSDGMSYEVVTPNDNVVEVRTAIMAVYGDKLRIEQPSTFTKVGSPIGAAMDAVVFPVEGKPPVGRLAPENWNEFTGGVAIYLEKLDPPVSAAEVERRIANQRLQPAQDRTLPATYVYSAVGRDVATSEVVILAADENVRSSDDVEAWTAKVAEPLWKLANEAVNRPPELAKVSSFNPQVAGSMQQDALVALVIALFVIMAYVWVRFGSLRYGTATVVALLHDSLFVIAALGFAHALDGTGIDRVLATEPFRINLTVVAAVLTVMGYSMADTIVVFDRIRELRGQRGLLTKQVINDAVNQTLSRTLLTAGTTIATLFVMYVYGGTGIHSFTYVLLIGILVGTYSSIAIAAPILLIGLKPAGGESKSAASAGSRLQRA